MIGKGGFATVYLAHYEGQKVAVKELLAKRENAQEDMEATSQFRSEVCLFFCSGFFFDTCFRLKFKEVSCTGILFPFWPFVQNLFV